MRRRLALLAILVVGLNACATKPKSVAPTQNPPAAPAAPEENRPQGAASPDAVSLSALQGQFAAQAGDRVYFELDSHVLGADAEAALARQAAWLVRHPEVGVLVEGNCDERGTREYNLALGARRANAAMTYLAGRGVAAGRMRTISYGKERPVAAEASEAAWSQNRNAHSVLLDAGQ